MFVPCLHFVVLPSLPCWLIVSIDNVLQPIPNHTLSFAPSYQFIPSLTSTSAKVLNAFTPTGSFLKRVQYWFFPSMWYPPHSLYWILITKQACMCWWTQPWTPHSVKLRFLQIEVAAKERRTHQLSTAHNIREKMNLLCLNNMLNSSLATQCWSGVLTEIWMDSPIVLCCRPTRKDMIMWACEVFSAFLSHSLLTEITTRTFCWLWRSGEVELMLPSACSAF